MALNKKHILLKQNITFYMKIMRKPYPIILEQRDQISQTLILNTELGFAIYIPILRNQKRLNIQKKPLKTLPMITGREISMKQKLHKMFIIFQGKHTELTINLIKRNLHLNIIYLKHNLLKLTLIKVHRSEKDTI